MSAGSTLKGLIAAEADHVARVVMNELGAALLVEIRRLADGGLFGVAKRLVRVSRVAAIPSSVLAELGLGERRTEQLNLDALDYLEYLLSELEDDPAWQQLNVICELADRVDNFLAVLEVGGEGGQVARACRDDLELLPVLADWHEEHGRPTVAAETRHLLGIVRSVEIGQASRCTEPGEFRSPRRFPPAEME
jgi:hypothetical protein